MKDLDVELHELPDFDKGVRAERERILNILYNKGLELEKDVSLDDEASRTRYLFMLDIIEIVKNSGNKE